MILVLVGISKISWERPFKIRHISMYEIHQKDSPFMLRHSPLIDPLSLTTLIGLWPRYPGILTAWFSTMFCLIMVFLALWPTDCLLASSLISVYGMKPLYPGIWDVTFAVPTESSFILLVCLVAPAGRMSLGKCPNLPMESANSVM